MSGFGVISPESKGKVFFLQSHMVALMFNCHKVGFLGVVFFFFLKKAPQRKQRHVSFKANAASKAQNAMQEMLSFRKNTLSLLK